MRVSYAYCLVLGRAVDGAGFKGWMAALERDTTIPNMLQAMLASGEFSNRHKLTRLNNVEFVTLLYRVLLHREPNSAAMASYVEQLNGGAVTRTDLARLIVASNDFASRHPLLAPR